MDSPFANIFLAIQERIDTEVPEIKYIDQNFGQLEGYTDRPSVAFPCILTDFEGWTFENLGTLAQKAEGDVVIKLGFASYRNTSNVTTETYRKLALAYYEIEWKLHKALHGWSPGDDLGTLTRIANLGENRPMGVRVRTLRYRLGFEDYSTKPTSTFIALPDFELST